MSADEVKFRKPVFPGDTLFIHAELTKTRGNRWRKPSAAASVNDAVVSEGELMFTLPRIMSDAQIHPTAIVDASAEIGAGTIIGPYCIVGSGRGPRRELLAAASRHALRAHARRRAETNFTPTARSASKHRT